MNNRDFRIVFMGTASFAVESLRILIDKGFQIVGVVTATDKPAGRGQNIRMSEIKQFALKHKLKIYQPVSLKDRKFISEMKALDAHLFVVVAFRMLPEAIWKLPSHGTINLHASLLPKYRGAAPINRAIMNGEKVTGVTTFFINDKIDEGSILLQQKVEIPDDMYAGELHDRLMVVGADLLGKTVSGIMNNNLKPVSQNQLINADENIHTAPKIFKKDCRINWYKDVVNVYNHIRGLSPYPAAWSVIEKEGRQISFKIYRAEIIHGVHDCNPGEILTDQKSYIYITADGGLINILTLQLENKKKMQADELLRGFSLSEYKLVL